MTAAIIMAGGRSSRMRASLGRTHKALVKVLGVSMLERNLLMLLSHNVRQIFLAISSSERSLLAFAQGRAQKIAYAGGAKLNIFLEETSLGTMGAARAIETASDDLLVVNVDNLTSLDLSALVEHHRVTKAALTVATHIEPFPVPFGQVSIQNGRIVGYAEKPVIQVPLCSGVYVVSKKARLKIPFGKPIGAPELVNFLLRAKQEVSAFCHSSPWIDVNDSSSLDKAEELIVANFERFELWRQPASEESVTLCVLNGPKVALVQYPSRLTPEVADETALLIAFRLRSQIGIPDVVTPHILVSFDELNIKNGRRIRHHIFVAEKIGGQSTSLQKKGKAMSWKLLKDLLSSASRADGNARTIAYLQRYVESKNTHSLRHR